VLRPKQDVGALAEGQSIGGSRIAVEDTRVQLARALSHDDPQAIHTPIDDPAPVPRFDVEKKLHGIAG
jgi:hypothetical protein